MIDMEKLVHWFQWQYLFTLWLMNYVTNSHFFLILFKILGIWKYSEKWHKLFKYAVVIQTQMVTFYFFKLKAETTWDEINFTDNEIWYTGPWRELSSWHLISIFWRIFLKLVRKIPFLFLVNACFLHMILLCKYPWLWFWWTIQARLTR